MVALTYDVRTVHIAIPRLVLGAGRARLRREPRPAAAPPPLGADRARGRGAPS